MGLEFKLLDQLEKNTGRQPARRKKKKTPGFQDSLTLVKVCFALLEILNYVFSTDNTNGAK